MNKVFRTAKVGLSKEKLANFMWAVLKTNAKVTAGYALLLGNGSRKSLSRGKSKVMVEIDKDKIELFEKLSGITFVEPIKIIL